MPSADQHRRKAESNRRFLDSIVCADFPDWKVTVAFYTAVHVVERLRAASGDGHSTSHEDRLAYVRLRHTAIHSAYHVLLNVSLLARYQSHSEFFAQFQPEDMEARLLPRLVEVERYAQARLGPAPA
jgi:hypothetical protein